jgi:hypothetical protein
MERDHLLGPWLELQPTCLDELFNELRVVNHVEVCAEFWVLVLEGVEAVWALGEKGLNVVLLQQLS